MEIIAKLYPILDNHDGYNILIGEDEPDCEHSILFACGNKSIELYYIGMDYPSLINIPISIRKHIINICTECEFLPQFITKSMRIYYTRERHINIHKIDHVGKLYPYANYTSSKLTLRTKKLIVFFIKTTT